MLEMQDTLFGYCLIAKQQLIVNFHAFVAFIQSGLLHFLHTLVDTRVSPISDSHIRHMLTPVTISP